MSKTRSNKKGNISRVIVGAASGNGPLTIATGVRPCGSVCHVYAPALPDNSPLTTVPNLVPGNNRGVEWLHYSRSPSVWNINPFVLLNVLRYLAKVRTRGQFTWKGQIYNGFDGHYYGVFDVNTTENFNSNYNSIPGLLNDLLVINPCYESLRYKK